MKILFTCVGRRVELMQAFRRAADELKFPLEIYGTDMDMTAPALLFCDRKCQVPPIRSEEYIPYLLDFCEKEGIDGLIPTIDTDLMLLAINKNRFTAVGTKVFISAVDKVSLCRDKRYTADYFLSLGLESPRPCDRYKEYNGGFPAFIKPRDGSSSIFAYRVDTPEDLREYARRVPDYVIQPFIKGTEYTVDIFCDYEGNPVYITPRIRLAVRSGEVLKTRIVHDPDIEREMKILIDDFKPCGAITVQMIREEKTGKNVYIEINPRYGGGAPLSILAGADSAKALLRILNREELSYQPDAAEEDAVYSRFDQSVRVN